MEEATQTQETPEVQETVTPDRPDENHIAEARKKQRKAEKQAEDALKRLADREDQDRSESEKLQKRAEEAEQRAQELETKTLKLERGSWVRAAAKDFHDPDDAVVRASLEDIESEKDAERFVKDLGKSKPHLLKPENPEPPQIGQVLKAGEKQTPQQAETAQRTDEEVERARGFADTLKKMASDWQ